MEEHLLILPDCNGLSYEFHIFRRGTPQRQVSEVGVFSPLARLERDRMPTEGGYNDIRQVTTTNNYLWRCFRNRCTPDVRTLSSRLTLLRPNPLSELI